VYTTVKILKTNAISFDMISDSALDIKCTTVFFENWQNCTVTTSYINVNITKIRLN